MSHRVADGVTRCDRCHQWWTWDRPAPSFPHATLISPLQVAVASSPLPPVIRKFLCPSLLSVFVFLYHCIHPQRISYTPSPSRSHTALSPPSTRQYHSLSQSPALSQVLSPPTLSRSPTLAYIHSPALTLFSSLRPLAPLLTRPSLFCTFYFAPLHPLPRPRVFALSRLIDDKSTPNSMLTHATTMFTIRRGGRRIWGIRVVGNEGYTPRRTVNDSR